MKIYVCHICGEVYIGKDIPPSCPFCGVENKFLRLGHAWIDANIGVEPTEKEKELLREALDLEMSNVGFYQCVSKTCTTIEIAKMFKALMKQEKEHAEVFQKLLKLESLPETNENCEDKPKEILDESLAREVRATEFYTRAIGESSTLRVVEVFTAIRDVELTHQELDKETGKKYK